LVISWSPIRNDQRGLLWAPATERKKTKEKNERKKEERKKEERKAKIKETKNPRNQGESKEANVGRGRDAGSRV